MQRQLPLPANTLISQSLGLAPQADSRTVQKWGEGHRRFEALLSQQIWGSLPRGCQHRSSQGRIMDKERKISRVGIQLLL